MSVAPLDLNKFFKSCTTKILVSSGKYHTVHSIDGRLIKSAPSNSKTIKTDYFLVKLSNPNLLQRYMTISRELDPIKNTLMTNIRRYSYTLEESEEWMSKN